MTKSTTKSHYLTPHTSVAQLDPDGRILGASDIIIDASFNDFNSIYYEGGSNVPQEGEVDYLS